MEHHTGAVERFLNSSWVWAVPITLGLVGILLSSFSLFGLGTPEPSQGIAQVVNVVGITLGAISVTLGVVLWTFSSQFL